MIFAFEKLICPNTHNIAHLHDPEDHEHHHHHHSHPNGKERVHDSMTKLNGEHHAVEEVQHKDSKTDLKAQESDVEINTANCCQSLVIMFALGFHSLFEGLALGINSIEEDVVGLVLGIGIHKWAEGLSIVRSEVMLGCAFD